MFNLPWSFGAHNRTAMAPTTNSPIAEQPKLSIASSFQPNPLKRKRDSGCDAAWPVGNTLDTRCMEHAGPFVLQFEPNSPGRELRRESAGFDEPSAVTSPDTATENGCRGSQGGALWHDDSTLSGKSYVKSTVLPATDPGYAP